MWGRHSCRPFRWTKKNGFTNGVLEIANEFPHGGFNHSILKTALARETTPGLLVSTSGLGGSTLPNEVCLASDFLLIHFNCTKPADIPNASRR